MELAIRNNEKIYQPHVNRRKRKCTALIKSKPPSSNKVICLSSKSSKAKAIGEDGHFYECMKCNEVGSLICCDTCSCTYHHDCLNPPLKSIPDGDWFCPNCPDDESEFSRKRRSSVKRACNFSSRCSLCSNIKKISISDENEFFISKSKSTGQIHHVRITLVDEHDSPEQTNVEVEDSMNQLVSIGAQSGQVQKNGNVRLHRRLRGRPKGKRIVKKASKRRSDPAHATSSSQFKKNGKVHLRPRPRGRPKGKQIVKKKPSKRTRSGSKQDVQNQNSDLSIVLRSDASANTTDAQRKVDEDGWSGEELDALWVGVRRHGPGKWETIMADPNLRILQIKNKTPRDLSMKWVKEREIMASFLPKPPSLLLSSVPEERPGPAVSNGLNGRATTQQLLPANNSIPVTSPESAAALGPSYQASSSSRTSSLPRAHDTATAPPPHWAPDLNLDPKANELVFESLQRNNANPETQMRHMGVQAYPTPGPGVAMATQRPSANSTVLPNLFIGGHFPIPYAYGGPSYPVPNPY